MNRKIWMFFATMFIWVSVAGQSKRDTAKIIKEIEDVLSFSRKPVISYETETRINAVPAIGEEDVLTMNGKFVKNGRQLYYRSGDDEILIVDSIMLQISHKRKSIWILKLNQKQQEDFINGLPAQKQMPDVFGKNFIVQKEVSDDKQASVSFYSKNYGETGNSTKTTIEYDVKQMLPQAFRMEISMKEEADEELLAALSAEGIDVSRLVVKEDGKSMLTRKQFVNITLKNWSLDEEKPQAIPSPYDYVVAGFETGEPVGKGLYADYEVRRLF